MIFKLLLLISLSLNTIHEEEVDILESNTVIFANCPNGLKGFTIYAWNWNQSKSKYQLVHHWCPKDYEHEQIDFDRGGVYFRIQKPFGPIIRSRVLQHTETTLNEPHGSIPPIEKKLISQEGTIK